MSSFIDELCEKYKMFLNENNFQINDIPENIRNYVFKGKQKSIAKKFLKFQEKTINHLKEYI